MPVFKHPPAPERLLTDLRASAKTGSTPAQVNLRPSFLRRYRVPLAILTLVVFSASIFGTRLFTQAAVAYFHPQACLGTWEDAKKAQGKPDVNESSDIGPHNAAVFTDDSKEMYCGSFEGEIPGGTALTSLKLHLSWIASEERITAKKILVPATPDEHDGAASHETAPGAVDSQSPNSAEFDIHQVMPPDEENDAVTDSPVSEEQDAPTDSVDTSEEAAPVDEPAPSEPADAPSEPSAFLFVRQAHAQEINEVTTEPVVADETPVEPPIEAPLPVEETPVVDVPAEPPSPRDESGATDEAPIIESGEVPVTVIEDFPLINPESEPIDAGAFLTIAYSFDGEAWMLLKNVTAANFMEDVMLPITSWEDIGRLQIRIAREEMIDDAPFVYLDGMELVAEYDDGIAMPMPDFEKDVPLSIVSNDRYVLIRLTRAEDGKEVLWLFERTETPQWRVLATEETMGKESPVALRDSFAFWMSADRKALFGFDIAASSAFSATVVNVTPTEREVVFDDYRQKVRISGDTFTFIDVGTESEAVGDNDTVFSSGFWEAARVAATQAAMSSTTTSTVETSSTIDATSTTTPPILIEGETVGAPAPAEEPSDLPEPVTVTESTEQ